MSEVYFKKMEEQEIRTSTEYLNAKTNFLNNTLEYTIKEYIENLQFLIKLNRKNKFKTKEVKAKILDYEDLIKEITNFIL